MRYDPLTAQLRQETRRYVDRWWVFVALGLAGIIVGALLILDLTTAVWVLALLAGLSLMTTGLLDLAAVDRFTPRWLGVASGVLFVGAGVLAIVWPGVTLTVLAVVTGLGLLAGGVTRIFGGLADRALPWWWVVLLGGILSVIAGILALLWPTITILVLALLLGLRTVLIGAVELSYGLTLRRLREQLF